VNNSFFLEKKEGLVYFFFLRYITLLEGVVDLFGPDAPMKMLRCVLASPSSLNIKKRSHKRKVDRGRKRRVYIRIFFLAHSLAHVRNRSVLQSGLFFFVFFLVIKLVEKKDIILKNKVCFTSLNLDDHKSKEKEKKIFLKEVQE